MTTLVRFDPFRELASLQGEMSRLVNGLFDGQPRALQSWVPPVDVWETGSDLVYAFDVPGIPEDKLSIEFHDDVLTVSGEREKVAEEQGDRFRRFERRYGTFSRAVSLPQGIDEAKISARYKDGVLEVHVPKPEESRPRKIQIGTGGAPDIEQTPRGA